MATPEDDSVIQFEPLKMEDAESTHSIRLIESKGEVHLLTAATQKRASGFPEYETVIHAQPLDGKTAGRRKRLFSLTQLLPPPPRWDAATGADGSAFLCFESAGGAINALQFQTAQGAARSATGKYPLSSFSHPRFVKRRRSPGDATVVAVQNDKQLVVFPGKVSAPHGEHHILLEAAEGLLVDSAQDYTLFCKVVRPGLARGDVPPGELQVSVLRRDFRAPSELESPMRTRAVYEFDADVAGDYLAVFVTTSSDLLLMRRLAAGGTFKPVGLEGKLDLDQLRCPCILATRTHLYLAVLENPGTPSSRVLAAHAPLEAVK
jgi:hypothetical protein